MLQSQGNLCGSSKAEGMEDDMSEENLDRGIASIESLRGSKVLTYVTSDRQPPLKAQIATDSIPIFFEHLKKIGNTDKIDLFIFSTGGDIMPPWRLVNLIREFTKNFNVLVPYRAHSAATMIALGADEIVMGRLGELSPIDPKISTPFNPPHPDVPNEPKTAISVEDVFGYFNLAKEKLKVSEQTSVISVLESLTDKVHPLALGAVYRTHSLIRLLAAKLLGLHMDEEKAAKKIDQIVEDLVEKLYYHNYLINRKEAKKLGLKIVFPSDELEQLMWDLYSVYEREMGLGQPFNPMQLLPVEQKSHKMKAYIACISSKGFHTKYQKSIELSRLPSQQPGATPQIGVQENSLGWKDFESNKED